MERDAPPAPFSPVAAAPFSPGETRAWAAGEEPVARVHAGVTTLFEQEAVYFLTSILLTLH